MKGTSYQIADRKDSRALAEFLAREGQLLLPMLELITASRMAVDERIDVAGRAILEAVLTLSAQEVAGPRHPGKAAGPIRWHGRQNGVVSLAERSFEDKDILIVYLDGLVFGVHHVLVAVGVDSQGFKHVLGLKEGASENQTVAIGLLEDLVARGVKPGRLARRKKAG